MAAMSDFVNILRGLRKLTGEEKREVDYLSKYMSPSNLKQINSLIKQKRLAVELKKSSVTVVNAPSFPHIIARSKEPIITQLADDANEEIRVNFRRSLFKDVAEKADEIIPRFIAPNITGLDIVKKATALQLFAKEHVHILLLGDPGTGKTDILRSSSEYAPIGSFGLGSGTSGVGLAASAKGDDIIKGLLPMADNGLCCIDELNLMKEDSRAGLYNAMEKGFVTYDKGGNHMKFYARVNVLATANPKGDRFKGYNIKELKQQLPFDPALLTRFHLVFLIWKPTMSQFREITKKILSGNNLGLTKADANLMKAYVKNALGDIDKVQFPHEFEEKVTDLIAQIKSNESQYLVEISPRITIGFMRLCMASARMHHRDRVNAQDIESVSNILKQSLKVF